MTAATMADRLRRIHAGRGGPAIGEYVSVEMQGLGFVLLQITRVNWAGFGVVTGLVVAFQGNDVRDQQGGPAPAAAPFQLGQEIEVNVREIVYLHGR